MTKAIVDVARGLGLKTIAEFVEDRDTLELLEEYGVDYAQGFGIQRDLTWHAYRNGYQVVEVPIDFDERTEGASKMSSDIVREALVKVTLWGLARRAQGLRKALR